MQITDFQPIPEPTIGPSRKISDSFPHIQSPILPIPHFVIMANFQAVGEQFVTFYYSSFDTNRDSLRALYNEFSMLTFEGEQHRGVDGIMTKIKSMSFQTIKHQITTMDCQPSSTANGILVFVSGFMQMDQDNPFKFSQVFHLNQQADGHYFVFNDMFRLALG